MRLVVFLPLLGKVLSQNLGGQPASSNPSGFNFVPGFMPRSPGSSFQNSHSGFNRNRVNDLKDRDWSQIDRRSEEGWWHLYGFGEKFFDNDIVGRPWNDQQIDLDFFFPYFGFRFNYTFVFPEGFVAFSYPWYAQPPYTFPNPRWPNEPDPCLIAAFMSAQQQMFVGDTSISHVWYRIISRPPNMIGNVQDIHSEGITPNNPQSPLGLGQNTFIKNRPSHYYRTYRGQTLKTEEGRVEDPSFLNQVTGDIRHAMVGTRGFTADYALVVTWERMAYGGAPKVTTLNQYDQVKKWQNTYQMVIATDEIRSYAMFNYANINWTSSTSAGALFGRGGKQSALVGFNGGNGTGFVDLPYSAEGNSYKLVQFGSTQTAGRWIARVDEVIQYGGCSNDSIGKLQLSDHYFTMLGGYSLNVSGPCFRHNSIIKLQLDELTLDCEKIDMVIARCVVPVNSIYRTGFVDVKLSVDGGKNYPFWSKFYVLQPGLSRRQVNLKNDPMQIGNNWKNPDAENLTLTWEAFNITANANAQVDITLWGYWEDVEGHDLIEVGSIARSTTNTGVYSFNPRTLAKNDMRHNAWKKYLGGVIQVRVTDNWMSDRGDGLYWSNPIPFGWYYKQAWEYNYGDDWATDICLEWFDYDGRRENFYMDLEPKIPCPCTLEQAVADVGKYTGLPDCDMNGDSQCYYTRGAKHCVVSTVSAWTGAGQMCCYDQQGWLMFSDDYEFNPQYLRFYSAGVPYRAHPWGSFPYKRPPYVPTMSNFYNDLMPYEYCCKWAGKCEFFFWRRQTSGCQEYRPPALGIAYGEPHFITYDGTKYSFNGQGYYVLSMMKSSRHDFMCQVRLEQPPKTIWNSVVRATVITGLAAQDNSSAIVQIFARKDFRRWRYKTDVYVDGIRIFFDEPHKKIQTFQGVTLRSPPRNMNQSEILIMFATGVGVKVLEARGLLNIIVSLPKKYNETLSDEYRRKVEAEYRMNGASANLNTVIPTGNKCATHVRTLGLLGTYNQDRTDDLLTADCSIISVSKSMSEIDARNLYVQFGEKWKVDAVRHRLLFQTQHKPIYDPLSFGDPNFVPQFDVWRVSSNRTMWESLIFSRDEVRISCQGVASCEFDYILTGRKEIAIDTLHIEKKFEGLKRVAERKVLSCGPLQKNKGVLKHPPGNNYLDGITVTFTCKPEYFLHGTQQRSCINGTWSPGWWVWCRSRTEENVLKWLTGICVSLLIIAFFTGIFLWCYCLRLRNTKGTATHFRQPHPPPPQICKVSYQVNENTVNMQKIAENNTRVQGFDPGFNIAVLDREPSKGGR